MRISRGFKWIQIVRPKWTASQCTKPNCRANCGASVSNVWEFLETKDSWFIDGTVTNKVCKGVITWGIDCNWDHLWSSLVRSIAHLSQDMQGNALHPDFNPCPNWTICPAVGWLLWGDMRKWFPSRWESCFQGATLLKQPFWCHQGHAFSAVWSTLPVAYFFQWNRATESQ